MSYPAAMLGTFTLFDYEHILTLLIIAASISTCILLLRAARSRPGLSPVRPWICYGVAVLLAANEVIGTTLDVVRGVWTFQDYLPLHLCDFAVFSAIATLIAVAPRQPVGPLAQQLYELTYYWGLAGTTHGLFTPAISVRFPDPGCVQFFVMHAAIVGTALLLTLGIGLRPRRGSVRRTWLITAALAGIVFGFDWVTKTNYMYLHGPPPNPSAIDYFGPWPWSLVTMAFVAAAVFWLLYLPFWINDRRKARQQELSVTT